MQHAHVQVAILILTVFLFLSILLFKPVGESFETTRSKVHIVLYMNDAISLDSRDPFFEYAARTRLLSEFSIKTRSTLKMCTSDVCIDTFDISPLAKSTNGVVDETSRFMFTREDTTLPAVTEYSTSTTTQEIKATLGPSNFATLPFCITVEATIAPNVKLTRRDLQQIIKNSDIKIWFDEIDPSVRSTFQIENSNSQFVPWSLNRIHPDLVLESPADKFRIRPRTRE